MFIKKSVFFSNLISLQTKFFADTFIYSQKIKESKAV
jgi:hypothetical protein